MNLPPWVVKEIQDFVGPATGKVVITVEQYQGGVTSIEIGGVVRFKPPKTDGS
jgi:hypothetical protein